jgi:hypothetical protein
MSEKIPNERLIALKNEVVMAEKMNEEELEPIMAEALSRYMGEFVPEFGMDWDIVLNEVYPIIQNNLPSIFFRNPRVFLKPRNKTFIAKRRDPVSGKMVDVELDSQKSARTQEDLLNYMLVEIKYKKEVRKVLLDALLFPHAILWHGYKGDFGMTDEQSIFIKDEQIFVKRISPIRFIYDPAVTMSNLEEARWVGRIIDVPLQDLIDDKELDVDKELKGFKGYGDRIGTKSATVLLKKQGEKVDYVKINSLRKPMLDSASKEYKDSDDSRFVKVYELFVRPTKKEKSEGKKGWILLLTDEQFKPLRVNEWTIKAEGFPAIVIQFNELNDAMFGLADVDTYSQAADQKNAIINLQLRNAQENSKVWVGISKEGATEEDIQHVQKGDQTIVLFESGNPRDRMFVASPGGQASSELYLIDQRIQKNLEDKSGVTDLKRGFLQSGEESAASVKLRAAGGGARPAYRQDIMSDFLKESMHYLNQLNKQFLPYDKAVRIVGSLDLEWSDNPSKEEIQADTDVELDVISMLPENPEKELAQLNTILALMMEALQRPAIITKLQQEGKTFNIAPLVEQMLIRMRLRDPEIFRNIKPEESQGFVSVQQIRQANANVTASITGQQVPYPPQPTDDHVAKLEVYTSVRSILQLAGQISDTLDQLIQMHAALLQQIQEQQATPGTMVKLSQPKMQTVGSNG